MVQADICKYIILSDTDRKKEDLQYPHPNVVHRQKTCPVTRKNELVYTMYLQRAYSREDTTCKMG